MGRSRPHLYAAALIVAALLLAGSAAALPVPAAPSCPVFPKSNPWNRPVDHLPGLRPAQVGGALGIGGVQFQKRMAVNGQQIVGVRACLCGAPLGDLHSGVHHEIER